MMQQPHGADIIISPVSSDDRIHDVGRIAPGEEVDNTLTVAFSQISDDQSTTTDSAADGGQQGIHQPGSARCEVQTMVVRTSYSQSPETLLSNPQLQMEFFSRQICKALCAYDSHHNPFRLATVPRADASLLSFSMCRYLTAAFLCSRFDIDVSKGWTVRSAQTEVLHRLQNEIARLDMSRKSEMEQVLMAIIMYGLSTNWDGSNESSAMHYNAAVWVFHQMYKKHDFNSSASDDNTNNNTNNNKKQFFQQSLIYWWMGLCFVTDSSENHLSPPPGTDDQAKLTLASTVGEKRLPHPLSGVSPESQYLLGRVGSLVYNQRKRCRDRPFTTAAAIQQEYNALEEAKDLEQALLSLDIPRAEDLVDIEDPDTPLQDLINTANVYRLSALVLLYHAFPDLLISRLGWRLDASLGPRALEEQRLHWLSALAIHALDTLCANSPTSGTRSIEQILLVILAGELRTTPSPSLAAAEYIFDADGSDSISDFDFYIRTYSPAEAAAGIDNVSSSLGDDHTGDGEANLDMSTFTPSPQCGRTAQDRISEARSSVLGRLKSIQEVLPYRSLQLVEDLVLQTWSSSDRFWLDVMIDNGWKFLLV